MIPYSTSSTLSLAKMLGTTRCAVHYHALDHLSAPMAAMRAERTAA